MTKEEKVLVDAYVKYNGIAKENNRLANETLKELANLSPHKKGEIIKWTEHKTKNVGTYWNPKIVKLSPIERVAVLDEVKASVGDWSIGDIDLYYTYRFKSINKDGSASKNCIYPHDYEWTGEIHKDYK